MPEYFKVVVLGSGKVVVRRSQQPALAVTEAAVFPESILGNQVGRRCAEFFAQAIRGPQPMIGTVEWNDMNRLASFALEVAPDVLARYSLSPAASPQHRSSNPGPSPKAARLQQEIERLNEQSTQLLQGKVDELTREIIRLANALGLEPTRTPTEIVDAAISKAATPPSREDPAKRIRQTIRNPSPLPPKSTR